MIERLLTSGSILELAIHRCVLGKDTLRLFPIRPHSLPIVVASMTKDLQMQPIKRCSALVRLDRHSVPGSCERTNDCSVMTVRDMVGHLTPLENCVWKQMRDVMDAYFPSVPFLLNCVLDCLSCIVSKTLLISTNTFSFTTAIHYLSAISLAMLPGTLL